MLRYNMCAVVVSWVVLASQAFPSSPAGDVQFDTLPVTVATSTPAPTDRYLPPNHRWVTFAIHVSALIETGSTPTPDEFLYQFVCKSPQSRVVAYTPTTQLAETTVGGIVVEQSHERSNGYGLNVRGSYQGVLQLDGGNDRQKKSSQKTKLERVAPQEVVSASGTLQRGQGVYFKLRSTPTHVLDGQKHFTITLEVPEYWRGSLVDVHVQATRMERSFAGRESEPTVSAQNRFQIAVFDESDDVARRWAWQLGESEQHLRTLSRKHARDIRERSLPTLFHQVAAAFDVIEPRISENWLDRVIFGQVDPYFDNQVKRLPVDVKVAVLEYLDAKSKFISLVQDDSQSQEAHSKLAINE